MLSRAELEFLTGQRQVSDNYRYYLTHSIRSKLAEFETTELQALLAHESTKEAVLRIFSKTLRENPKTTNIEPEQVSVNALNCGASQRVTKGPPEGFEPSPQAPQAYMLPSYTKAATGNLST